MQTTGITAQRKFLVTSAMPPIEKQKLWVPM
jgi:hypothetical protein